MCHDDKEEQQNGTLIAMLLDSVAPLVKMISLGSAPIRSATCCSDRQTTQSMIKFTLHSQVEQVLLLCKYH